MFNAFVFSELIVNYFIISLVAFPVCVLQSDFILLLFMISKMKRGLKGTNA